MKILLAKLEMEVFDLLDKIFGSKTRTLHFKVEPLVITHMNGVWLVPVYPQGVEIVHECECGAKIEYEFHVDGTITPKHTICPQCGKPVEEEAKVCASCSQVVSDTSDLIAHHKIKLTPDNCKDANISLNPANLAVKEG